MIASLRGRVISVDASAVIIEVNGVGYRVMLSTLNLASISGQSGEISLLTSMMVRDDSVSLYGFLTIQEQRLFERLITVSGVGPKVALSALSVFNAESLHQIILDEDVSRIATVPGIGKKTAQRIILELRGVLDTHVPGESGSVTASAGAQASEALLGMGFTASEISLALKGYEGDSKDVAGLIRFGLKRLGTF